MNQKDTKGEDSIEKETEIENYIPISERFSLTYLFALTSPTSLSKIFICCRILCDDVVYLLRNYELKKEIRNE